MCSFTVFHEGLALHPTRSWGCTALRVGLRDGRCRIVKKPRGEKTMKGVQKVSIAAASSNSFESLQLEPHGAACRIVRLRQERRPGAVASESC